MHTQSYDCECRQFVEHFSDVAQLDRNSVVLGLVSVTFVDHFATVTAALHASSAMLIPSRNTMLGGGLTELAMTHSATHICGTPSVCCTRNHAYSAD